MKPPRRFSLARALIALVTLLLIAGCSNPSEQERDPIALGSDLNFAGLEMRSVLIIASAKNEPGRLLGTIFNTTKADIQMLIGDADEQTPVRIPANGQIAFDTKTVILNTTPEAPGARTDLVVTANGQTTRLNVPIQDDTFDQYAPYVPSPGQ